MARASHYDRKQMMQESSRQQDAEEEKILKEQEEILGLDDIEEYDSDWPVNCLLQSTVKSKDHTQKHRIPSSSAGQIDRQPVTQFNPEVFLFTVTSTFYFFEKFNSCFLFIPYP